MKDFLHIVKNPQNCLVLEKINVHKVFAHKLMFVIRKRNKNTHTQKN
jgi:hypothetical protein